MDLIITVEARNSRGATRLAYDIIDKLKPWEEILSFRDEINDKIFIFSCNLTKDASPARLAAVLTRDIFDPWETFIDKVSYQSSLSKFKFSKNYKIARKVTSIEAADLRVSHLRKKGDPYIEVD